MKSPTNDEVNRTLNQLERTRMEIVETWMSDAEREGLPRVNVRDSGAPLLRTDEVLRGSYPDHARRK